MNELSLGQNKFLAEFLGNFSLAWLVGAVISPFLTGGWLESNFLINLVMGLINAGWSFILAFYLVKGVKS